MWMYDNTAKAVNLNAVTFMETTFRDSQVVGKFYTVAATAANGRTYDLGKYENEIEARNWLDAFVAKNA